MKHWERMGKLLRIISKLEKMLPLSLIGLIVMFFEIIILFLYLLAFETLVLFNGKAFNYFLLLSLNFDILKTSFWVKFLHAWTDVETKFGLMVLILLFCFIFHDQCVCVFFAKINLLSTETRMYQFVKNEEKSCYKSTMVLISSYLSSLSYDQNG